MLDKLVNRLDKIDLKPWHMWTFAMVFAFVFFTLESILTQWLGLFWGKTICALILLICGIACQSLILYTLGKNVKP